jgi:aspartate aminotransferase
MTVALAERVSLLKQAASIVAKEKVTQLRAAGKDVVDLTIGEPDLDTAPHIVEAAVAAMRRGETHYTATPGTQGLREAIDRKLERENGLSFGPDAIVVGCGAKQLIFEAFAATLEKGDEVVIPAPYWVSYPDMVQLNGGTPVFVRGDQAAGFKLRAADLAAAITPRTKWLVLNTPNNPSGAVYSRAEMQELATVLRQHSHVGVLVDEIYEHLVYDGQVSVNPLQVCPALSDRTLIVNGLSKSYAMTGWRIGYAAGPKALVAAIAKLIGQSTTCPSSISQAAAIAALDCDQASVREAAAIYGRRRDRMLELLQNTPGLRSAKPAGAFYLFPSVDGLLGRRTPAGQTLGSDLDVAMHFLDHGVAVLDGAPYGMSPHVRLSFATSLDQIEDGCARIVRACTALS